MSFGRCTHPWKCCHNEHSEHFHHPRNFMCFFASIPPSTPGNWSGILYLWNHMECALFYLASFSIMMLRFMYVVTSIGDLFHFIAEWYSVAWMYRSLFIYSPIDGHLSCFQFCAIVSSLTFLICFPVVIEIIIFFSFINTMNYRDWFSNVKPTLDSWNKPYFVTVHST